MGGIGGGGGRFGAQGLTYICPRRLGSLARSDQPWGWPWKASKQSVFRTKWFREQHGLLAALCLLLIREPIYWSRPRQSTPGTVPGWSTDDR